MCKLYALAILFSIALAGGCQPGGAQSAQEFWVQEFAKSQAKPQRTAVRVHAAPVSETPLISASVGLGGSWLIANLGAGRPQGAPGPWCGYAMRLEVVSHGRQDPGPAYNHVSYWCRWGNPVPVGTIGSIFVSRGHVSKVVAGECPPGHVRTISGNATGRRVSFMCEPISRAVCSRSI